MILVLFIIILGHSNENVKFISILGPFNLTYYFSSIVKSIS